MRNQFLHNISEIYPPPFPNKTVLTSWVEIKQAVVNLRILEYLPKLAILS
jgi:hypothetical protein